VPKTRGVLYQEEGGRVPFLDWFAGLSSKAQDKCRLRIERLRELGHELRRPEADYLRDGISELRASVGGIHYRILYFFHEDVAAVSRHRQGTSSSAEGDRLGGDAKEDFRGQPDETHLPRGMTMPRSRTPSTDAVEIIHRRFYRNKPERIAALEEARANDHIARKIYRLRQKAGLTQKQLAKRVGTTSSVISRLENADYDGHSMAMLRRIAAALDKRVEIRFVSLKRSA
jgi:DNA-binding XRE family transcriptional regulator/putative component of toxin-antitoxin plasmid stabilization module